MNIYYLKETRFYGDKCDNISIFRLDFENNQYDWMLRGNKKPVYNPSYDNMIEALFSHINYITYAAKRDPYISYDMDILTENEVEELLFLIGV